MSNRALPASIEAALSQDVIKPFYALDLLFDSGPVYLWTGNGNITRDFKTYIGAGSFLNISQVQETSDISAVGMNLSLSGIPSDIISLALIEPYQGRKCILWMGEMDAPDLTIVQAGYMDQMSIQEGPEYCEISLTVESQLIVLERPVIRRFTSAQQKARFPGDEGCDFLNTLKDVNWGGPSKESDENILDVINIKYGWQFNA